MNTEIAKHIKSLSYSELREMKTELHKEIDLGILSLTDYSEELITLHKAIVKAYCKENKEKIESLKGNILHTSKLMPIRTRTTDRYMSGSVKGYSFKTVNKKRVYFKYKVYPDGDIQQIN